MTDSAVTATTAMAPPAHAEKGLRAARLPRPGGARRTQAERSEETRGKLLAAAIKVLARRGCAGFTTQEAIKIAKVSRGAPQHHFRTTDIFLKAAIERLFDERRRASADAVSRLLAAGAVSDEHILSALIEDARGFYFGPLFPIVIDALNATSKKSQIRNHVIELAERYRPTAESMWRDLFVAEGFDAQDAEDLVWLSLTFLRGVAIRTTGNYEQDRLERTLQQGMQLLRSQMARLPRQQRA